MTLKEIMRGMLLESISNDEINDAINNHKYVVITYEGTDGTHNGKRMIQPVAFGLTTSGYPVIRSFENFGDTKTSVPKWKYFRVDRISSWNETNKTFNVPQPLFNPDDDKTMSVVYNIAKFGDNEETTNTTQVSSPKKNSDELFKTDTERGMEKLRKQLDNPITLSDFKTKYELNNTQNNKLSSGPKTKSDAKGNYNSEEDFGNGYNYNVKDNALDASNSNAKRGDHYYWQNRKNGKFAKGNITDNPTVDDTQEIEDYLNTDHGYNREIEELRNLLGNTDEPISIQDLKKKLGKE